MAELHPEHRYLTLDDYLVLEDQSSVRHEWVDGAVYAMAGASLRHNLIKDNISAAARRLPLSSGCRITTSDTKVQTERAVYYPDVVVACGPTDLDGLVEQKPCCIVEVLSPSTSAIDTREKLAAYRAMPSLQDYLVVEPDVRRIEHHHRVETGWEVVSVVGLGAVLIECLGGEIALDDCYAGSDA
jgi:Uma2 family endonuclease